jgi:membrane-bound serine protease (ClpP class)
MRSIAEQRDRNADVAETFVTDATSISAEEALEENVIDVITPTTEELLVEVDGETVTVGDGSEVVLRTDGAEITERSMGGFVGFLHTLLDPTLAFIFFWLGIALIVLELLVPGHIFSGTIGTAMLILAIVSFGVFPVQLIGVVLLVAAAALMILELNAPGFGVFGIAGTICLLLGGWFLYDRAGGISVSPGVLIGTAVFVGVFFAIVLRKVLRIRRLPPAQGAETVVGKLGFAIGAGLNPSGIVRVSSEEWRATSADGSAIPAGTAVRVTHLDGLTLTVEQAPMEHETVGSSPAEEGGNR